MAAESTSGSEDNRTVESVLFILGKALPVVPAKWVKKIMKDEFVDMADLLEDKQLL